MNKGIAPVIALLIAIVILGGGIGGYVYFKNKSVVCPPDTKQCPDGSYVSRIPPKCEFQECPNTPSAPEIPTFPPDEICYPYDPTEIELEGPYYTKNFLKSGIFWGFASKFTDRRSIEVITSKDTKFYTISYTDEKLDNGCLKPFRYDISIDEFSKALEQFSNPEMPGYQWHIFVKSTDSIDPVTTHQVKAKEIYYGVQ